MSTHSKLEDILRNELDDCERAIKKGDMTKAARELDDGVRKLKDLVSDIKKLERAARSS